MIVDATEQTFRHEVFESKIPVLVDVWGTWCGPCRRLAEELKKLDVDHHDALKIVRVNAEANPKVCQDNRIRSVPTVFLVRDGHGLTRFSGVTTKENLEKIMTHFFGETF